MGSDAHLRYFVPAHVELEQAKTRKWWSWRFGYTAIGTYHFAEYLKKGHSTAWGIAS